MMPNVTPSPTDKIVLLDGRELIAYTGKSGFRNPTLGVYIEGWMNCKGHCAGVTMG